MDAALPGRPDRARLLSDGAITLLVGGVFFVLAFKNGSYDTTTWAAAAVLVWWTLGLVAIDVLPGRQPRGTALLTGTLLALLGVWALVSTQWTADADAAYLQAAQVTLYVGAFFLVASTVTREAAPRILDGIALAIVAIALVALIGRLFPGFASTGAAGRALPAVIERLSWPVGYWNGLAMLVALGLPLLLRIVAGTRLAGRRCGGGGRDPAGRRRRLSLIVAGRRDRGRRSGDDVRGPGSRPLACDRCGGRRRRRRRHGGARARVAARARQRAVRLTCSERRRS